MKPGDIIKTDDTQPKQVRCKDNCSYDMDIFGGRIVSKLIGEYFQLEGDYSIWFKIKDFKVEGDNSELYEIY